jgi:hypothetical protein
MEQITPIIDCFGMARFQLLRLHPLGRITFTNSLRELQLHHTVFPWIEPQHSQRLGVPSRSSATPQSQQLCISNPFEVTYALE